MAKKVTLRKADINDAEILLEWRNDPDTIKNSVTQEKVSFFGHLAWLYRTINDPSIELYIAVDNLVPVGTIRIDHIDNPEEWLVSITVAPVARKNGYGTAILEHAISTRRNLDLLAFIRPANWASRAIFIGCGFVYCGTSTDDTLCIYRRPKELALTVV